MNHIWSKQFWLNLKINIIFDQCSIIEDRPEQDDEEERRVQTISLFSVRPEFPEELLRRITVNQAVRSRAGRLFFCWTWLAYQIIR